MRNRDVSAIPPDLRFPVFEIIMRATEGVEEYEDIVNYYRETFIPAEKVVALSVLGYGQSLELVRRTLAFAMSSEVRTQDILTAIATLRSSVIGRAELWNFMRHHWDILYERHCDDIGFLDYFVVLSIESFSTIERYHEVQSFFANKDTTTYDRILATCLEGIRMNILWLERDCKDVEEWLQANGYLTSSELSPSQVSKSSSGTGQHTPHESNSDTSTPLSQHSYLQLRSGYDVASQELTIDTQAQTIPMSIGPQQQLGYHVHQQLQTQYLAPKVNPEQQQQQLHQHQHQHMYQHQNQDQHQPSLSSQQKTCPVQGLELGSLERTRPAIAARPRTLEREMELLRLSGDYGF